MAGNTVLGFSDEKYTASTRHIYMPTGNTHTHTKKAKGARRGIESGIVPKVYLYGTPCTWVLCNIVVLYVPKT